MSAPRRLSLRRQLLLWLLLPQLVLWLAAAALAYTMAVGYANEVIDRSLEQSSRALARQVRPFGDGFYVDFPRAAREILEEDPYDRLYYMVSTPPGAFLLGDRNMPSPPAGRPQGYGVPYFYNGVLAGRQVRVAALLLPAGSHERPQQMLVQVARSRTLAAHLARSILVDMAVPLLGLMLLTSALVWAGVSRGLSPLRSLRRRVEASSARELAPIELERAPSEVRALTSAINTLLAEVHGQVASQRRFIADAAHQLRTPLAGLKSQAALVRERLSGAEPDVAGARGRLAQLDAGVDRSIRLVGQLLALARAEPEAGLEREALDLVALARAVTADTVPRALARRQDLGLDCDAERLVVEGNAGLLRELLANLLDNAVQYTPEGGEITVRLWRDGGLARLSVCDDGPGIPDAEKARVFERFYRGAAEGSGRGCGLGLAIVQEIAHRHGSLVTLSDHAPRGLCAELALPLAG